MSFPKRGHHTKETKKKQHDANVGEKNPFYRKHHTEESKRKIGAGNEGKERSKEFKKNLHEVMIGNTYALGYHPTKEAIEKMHKSHLGKHVGEKNGNYRGGKSREPYPLEFNDPLRESIRYRDGHQCQLCGVPQSGYFRKLDVHHIDHNPKNCHPSNLITLCRSCNSKVNSRANRDKWQKYFEKKIIYLIGGEKYARSNL